MLNETFYLDDEDAKDYGIRLQRPIEFSPAVPIVEKIHVPGRNGDLIFDTGAYENRTGKGSCFALNRNVNSEIVRASSFLLSNHGYRRLECSNDSDHFWKARIVNGAQIENRLNKLNPFDIEFDCMPQRFLVSGENVTEIKTGTVLKNSYGGVAKPLLKITRDPEIGTVYFTINYQDGSRFSCYWSTDAATGGKVLYFDCENQNCYSEKGNENKNIILQSNSISFPELRLGNNTFTFPSSIKKIEITPRWWDK